MVLHNVADWFFIDPYEVHRYFVMKVNCAFWGHDRFESNRPFENFPQASLAAGILSTVLRTSPLDFSGLPFLINEKTRSVAG